MRTFKSVEYYVDLYPGWQDNNFSPFPNGKESTSGLGPLGPGVRRFRFVVDLPMFGGTADAEPAIVKSVNEVEEP